MLILTFAKNLYLIYFKGDFRHLLTSLIHKTRGKEKTPSSLPPTLCALGVFWIAESSRNLRGSTLDSIVCGKEGERKTDWIPEQRFLERANVFPRQREETDEYPCPSGEVGWGVLLEIMQPSAWPRKATPDILGSSPEESACSSGLPGDSSAN